MSHFLEMDWNSKWDWESIAAFGSKTTENPKKLQLVEWTNIDDGSFNLSTRGGNSGASGSDGGHVSSAKSSISASDSSTKDVQTPDFRFMTYENFSGNFNNNTEMEGTKVSGTSPPPEASIGSVEPLIGLKLGKRTYFENSGSKSASSVMPTPSTTSLKKTKSPGQSMLMPRCAVEGCNIDLSMAKEYHRKHKVCDIHSKSPKVVVGGLERRFCQQCSRFHNLCEFDDKKRSCRRRLSDHNTRRRKPKQEAIQFNSSPFYGGRQQMNFLNNASLVHSRNVADTTWDITCNSKFTLTKGCIGDGVSSKQMHMHMHMPVVEHPHFINIQSNAAKGFLASKSSVADVSNSGSMGLGSHFCSHLEAAPEYRRRALSLLSSNSCASESMPLNPIHGNDTCLGQAMSMMHGMPEGMPLSSSEFWPPCHHQSTHPRGLEATTTTTTTTTNTNLQDIQLFITPYETDLYSNIMS